MTEKITLCGLTAAEMYDKFSSSGFSLKHSLAISNFLYKGKGNDIGSIRSIPVSLKKFLAENSFTGIYPPIGSQRSSDNSVKYLFRNEVGQNFEAVCIPDGKRRTVCVSAQSGCRMGCTICATGSYGFYGNLSAGDILNQVLSLPDAAEVTHVVFMGMGEPFDNLGNVLKASEILTAEWGMALSPGHVTISTVGITPAIQEFLDRSSCNLTLSLFSPFSEEREKLAGIERKYPVREIIDILSGFPSSKKRRISIAYVMLKGYNDTDRHLSELKKLFSGSKIRINLLPYHPAGKSEFESSGPERMQFFKHELVISGISASVRKSRGSDIKAACGLLASNLKRH